MGLIGIEFAPLAVPWRRRLQTVAAAAWFIVFAFGGLISTGLTVYLVLFTKFWWLSLLYCFYAFFLDKSTPDQGGRPSSWVKSWTWWKYLGEYFPIELDQTPWVELDPKRNYLFCCFPHGIIPVGAFYSFATNHSGFERHFPDHTPSVITLSQQFQAPFFRELALSLGGVGSSAQSISHVLNKPGGGSVGVLIVGGAQESYYCKPGQYRVVLKKRKGFIKLALKNGTPLVPVISFGETSLFTQVDSPDGSAFRNFQEWVRSKIGLAPVIPIGRGFFQYSFGLVPMRKPVTTVVGPPIDVQRTPNPSQEDIDKLHNIFMDKLQELFEEQKVNYVENPEETKLIIS